MTFGIRESAQVLKALGADWRSEDAHKAHCLLAHERLRFCGIEHGFVHQPPSHLPTGKALRMAWATPCARSKGSLVGLPHGLCRAVFRICCCSKVRSVWWDAALLRMMAARHCCPSTLVHSKGSGRGNFCQTLYRTESVCVLLSPHGGGSHMGFRHRAPALFFAFMIPVGKFRVASFGT